MIKISVITVVTKAITHNITIICLFILGNVRKKRQEKRCEKGKIEKSWEREKDGLFYGLSSPHRSFKAEPFLYFIKKFLFYTQLYDNYLFNYFLPPPQLIVSAFFFFHHMVSITLVGLDIRSFFFFLLGFYFFGINPLLRNDIISSILAPSKNSVMLFILKKIFQDGASTVHSVCGLSNWACWLLFPFQ